ncbi:Na+/H+ antiporter NhaC family protein [Botrimarina hoheduenensis]|nr:Na+/H+ antiporter NhaC family protein [Botrimarina hoheduenensis]
MSLAPGALAFVLAIVTRRTIEPLLAAVALGLLLIGFAAPSEPVPGVIGQLEGALDAFCESLLRVLADDVIRWIILVCGLFGSLIQVQTITGGAEAIGNLLARYVRGPRGVLLSSWLLGVLIFVDDYLNALTVGSTMRRLADRYRVSRAMLAYVVDSTAAPICVLIPASTWALYVSGLLEAERIAAPGEGLSLYISLLGTFVYAWMAALLVLLVAATGWPLLGPMRHEEQAAQSATPAVPTAAGTDGLTNDASWRAILTFILPLVVVLGGVLMLDTSDGNRVLKGVLVGLAIAILLGRVLTGVSFADLGDAALEGFARITPALAIVVISFVLRDVNQLLGLTEYLLATAKPYLNAGLLPAVAFLGLSLVTFTIGSFWGMYAVALPIVIPLAEQTGANVGLSIGAVVSAGAFGSHACFYGDATVLTSTSCEVSNMTHALTQLPYALVAATISFFIYLAWGLLT